MKHFLILIALFSITISAYSQYVYLGYPLSSETIKQGDLIIINIPEHIDGKFNNSKELERLIKFVNKSYVFFYNIEINTFYGTSYFSLEYSKSLSVDLEYIFKEKCKKSKYKIKSNGAKNPIVVDKDSPYYKTINTRIEILIE